jgi:hypothetical protein
MNNNYEGLHYALFSKLLLLSLNHDQNSAQHPVPKHPQSTFSETRLLLAYSYISWNYVE